MKASLIATFGVGLIMFTILGCGGDTPTSGGGTPQLVAGIQFPPDSAVIGEPMFLKAGIIGATSNTVVGFYLDGLLVVADSVSPYEYYWNPSLLPSGSSHTLKVIAADSDGRADTSQTRTLFAKWRLVATGSATASPVNLRNIYARSTDLKIEFRVEFDSNFTDYKSASTGIDCALFFDTDQSRSTGATGIGGGEIPIPIGDIGANYRAIIGLHGDSIWSYNSGWMSARVPRVLKVANPSNYFEFAVWHADIGGPAAFNLVAANVHFVSLVEYTYDWVPTSGHATYVVDQKYYGPAVGAPPSEIPPFSR